MGAEIVTIINDESEVTRLQDFYARQRELEAKAIARAAVLHASWRPMLAGAVGRGPGHRCVWVALPKFNMREVVVDHVVQHDDALRQPRSAGQADSTITSRSEVQRRGISAGLGPQAPYAARTPEENKFVEQRRVQDREIPRPHRQEPGWPRTVVRRRNGFPSRATGTMRPERRPRHG